MAIIDFNSLKVTTMTVIVRLDGNVIIDNLFPLLDITRLSFDKPLKNTKKFKMPYCNKRGAILSAKFRNVTRGLLKSKTKTSFLNSITMDICTSKKNINAKLSGEIIQMCGATSLDIAKETTRYIIDHILKIQNDLDYINSDLKQKEICLNWLKEHSVGDEYILDCDTQEILNLEDGERINENNYIIKEDGSIKRKEVITEFTKWAESDRILDNTIIINNIGNPYIVLTPDGNKEIAMLNKNFFIQQEQDSDGIKYICTDINNNVINIVKEVPIKIIKVNSIIIPPEYPNNYPKNMDPFVLNFYIKYAPDFAYHHVYTQFLNSVGNITRVIRDDHLNMGNIKVAMINYSYSLGMSINRWALANYINDLNDFKSRYINSIDHSVTISLPYKAKIEKSHRKKTKPSRHTFMVHKSGLVTQSGPNSELAREAYYKFMNTIQEIKDLIIQPDKPFNLKYKRATSVV